MAPSSSHGTLKRPFSDSLDVCVNVCGSSCRSESPAGKLKSVLPKTSPALGTTGGRRRSPLSTVRVTSRPHLKLTSCRPPKLRREVLAELHEGARKAPLTSIISGYPIYAVGGYGCGRALPRVTIGKQVCFSRSRLLHTVGRGLPNSQPGSHDCGEEASGRILLSIFTTRATPL